MPERSIAVAAEVGARLAFASALDWPGWCRAGPNAEDAVATLESYRLRYAPVAECAGLKLPGGALNIAEEVAGTTTTDFGAPDVVVPHDTLRSDAAAATRFVSLLGACWETLDDVAAHAPPQLRKGPRGGGRDRDEMVAHVVEAERSYARKIGVRMSAAEWREGGVQFMRERISEVLRRGSDGSALVEGGWPPRYFIRRTAWHALDHAWEMQDRS